MGEAGKTSMLVERVLTFVGAYFAVEVWHQVLSYVGMLGPGPASDEFPLAKYVIPAVVALLFVIADFIINREPAEKYSRLVLGSLLVGFAGAIVLVLLLFIGMFATGKVSVSAFGHELREAHMNAVPLGISAFLSILLLKSIYFAATGRLSAPKGT